MVLRSDELHRNLQHLNGMLTTHEAAKQLDLSYWHFMHLVEAGRIPGVRVVDRWLFSPDDLDDYRRSKYGKLEDMARAALSHPAIDLTEKQATICQYLIDNQRPSEIARKLHQSRQAVHSQISLIREKVSRNQAEPADNVSVLDRCNSLDTANVSPVAAPSSTTIESNANCTHLPQRRRKKTLRA
ncbi:MAG TPA: helix-turn-helix domain-containing protein [Ktedonosporobacter sp.]|jgi:excisionase family DNA binding protein|nr:helix-turn-helix domain-containing protein [Ktedonosporobacter sp.]